MTLVSTHERLNRFWKVEHFKIMHMSGTIMDKNFHFACIFFPSDLAIFLYQVFMICR
jgi:hypothetical protein